MTLKLAPQQRLDVIADVWEKLAADQPQGDAQSRARNDFARRLLSFHLRVNELMDGRVFRDPAWPMLLDIFVAANEGRKVTVTCLARTMKISPTTGVRLIERLEGHGLLARRDDPADARRTFVEPTAKGNANVGRVLDEMRAVL